MYGHFGLNMLTNGMGLTFSVGGKKDWAGFDWICFLHWAHYHHSCSSRILGVNFSFSHLLLNGFE